MHKQHTKAKIYTKLYEKYTYIIFLVNKRFLRTKFNWLSLCIETLKFPKNIVNFC